MKNVLLMTLALLTITIRAHAQDCPNFSGEYAFDKAWNGSVIVEQKGCEEVKLSHVRARGDIFVEIKKIDGRKYEGLYDSLKLVTDPSYPYDHHMTRIVDGRLVMNSFQGAAKDCEAKYSFSSFECKLYEHSFGYNADGVFTYKQIGSWRSFDGRYEDEEFTLKKVR